MILEQRNQKLQRKGESIREYPIRPGRAIKMHACHADAKPGIWVTPSHKPDGYHISSPGGAQWHYAHLN